MTAIKPEFVAAQWMFSAVLTIFMEWMVFPVLNLRKEKVFLGFRAESIFAPLLYL